MSEPASVLEIALANAPVSWPFQRKGARRQRRKGLRLAGVLTIETSQREKTRRVTVLFGSRMSLDIVRKMGSEK
jgi:hypothetical protein